MKILHILDHYKPHFSGYVFRTSYILQYQRKLGLDPVVLTSPKQGDAKTDMQEMDNVRIYHTRQNNFGIVPFIKEVKLMKALQRRIEEVIHKEKPDIIHAHSPSLNGIPSLREGRKYGIPVVYEVRAFWEDAAVDHGTFSESSLQHRASRFIETNLLKKVDAVFTICEGLKRDMISRGISGDRITVIPNCVDADSFYPVSYDMEIAGKYNLRNKIVYGYIGSFYKYEGVDLLIESFAGVLKDIKDARLLLVGDGEEKEKLIEKTSILGLDGKIIFTGKMPHEEVKKYYSVVDILVYPRKRMRLTELVTPLKPLEAMAMGKVVVGSDVGGIMELITDGENGFLFKAGDTEALSRLMHSIAVNRKNLQGISKTAIETVMEKHLWESAVKRCLPVYERLLK